ncbi:hypothetical protein [Actinoplanes sp. NPDC049265]|uniref:hypothetical protein n=1 Tax=Actinoplanes sp. NPDC049265 TaxID=3363902 RepID=UPI003714AA34
MRRYLLAAAVMGGLVLFGAGPARADDQPLPAVDQVGGLVGSVGDIGGLGPAGDVAGADPLGGGVTVPNPLDSGAPAVDFQPGDNSVTPPTLPATAPKAATTKTAATTAASSTKAATSNAPATGTESRLAGSNLPLLGGLLPQKPVRTLPTSTDISGLPPGGTDVPPGGGNTTPAAGPGDDQQRLDEEPIDGESARPFSEGRPVAGQDPDYK